MTFLTKSRSLTQSRHEKSIAVVCPIFLFPLKSFIYKYNTETERTLEWAGEWKDRAGEALSSERLMPLSKSGWSHWPWDTKSDGTGRRWLGWGRELRSMPGHRFGVWCEWELVVEETRSTFVFEATTQHLSSVRSSQRQDGRCFCRFVSECFWTTGGLAAVYLCQLLWQHPN